MCLQLHFCDDDGIVSLAMGEIVVSLDHIGKHGVTDKVAVFELSGRLFAFPVAKLREFLPMAELASLPGLPPFFAGILNLGGKAVSVLRLDKIFGLPLDEPSIHSSILVLRNDESPTAFIAASVLGIVQPSTESQAEIPESESFGGCVASVFQYGERQAGLIRPDRLLLAAEVARIEAFRAQEQERLSRMAEGL